MYHLSHMHAVNTNEWKHTSIYLKITVVRIIKVPFISFEQTILFFFSSISMFIYNIQLMFFQRQSVSMWSPGPDI